MTQGGFETGSDYVAAKVSFDIDNGGVSSLKELSEELGKFRTATEAATRTGADFIKYLQSMTQLANQATEAQTNLVAQLEKMANSQQSLMTGQGTQVTRGLPQGRVDPLSGMGGGSGAGGNRQPSVTDASSYLGSMATQDPRQYFNMQSNWGNVRTGDIPAASPSDQDLAQHAQRHNARDKAQNDQAASSDPFSPLQRRISGMTSGASQLLNEMQPGQNGFGLAGMAQQGLASLSGMARQSGAAVGGGDASVPITAAGAMGGMLGKAGAFLGTGAGMAATGIGAGIGAGLLYQQGGEMVQNYRSMGQQRGGGFQEGVGYEMAIRSMALNPFISTDQARQIVASGLSSGYTGKEFDTVTQFMANNLKDMNMSVADSMKLFKKNVVEGGMSQEGLSTALETLKVGSKSGYATNAQLQEGYAGASEALIGAGVPGAAASRTAGGIAFTFNGIADLADKMPQLASSALSQGSPIQGFLLNPAVSGVQIPPGTAPGEAFEAMGEGKQGEAIYNVMRSFAVRFSSLPKGRAVTAFQAWLQQMFPQMDWSSRTMVQKLMTELVNNPNAVKQGQQKYDKSRQEAMAPKERGIGSRIGGAISGTAGVLGGVVGDLIQNLGRDPGEEEGWEWDRTKRASNNWDLSQANVHSPVLDAVIQSAGGSGNVQVSSGGKWGGLDINNEQQIRDIAAGKAKIRPKGDTSSGVTLKEVGDGKGGFSGSMGGGANAFSVAPVTGSLTVTIDQNGRASAPPTVALGPSTVGANAGAGGYSPNNPRPGEGGFTP